jgi:tetratricopeptide (TPR) repeat protein
LDFPLSLTIRTLAFVAILATASCSNPGKHLEAGNRYFEAKQYAEAIVEFQNALRLDEHLGDARYKLASAYAAVGNPEAAFREYIRAADLLPTNAEVQVKAAAYLVMDGQFQDAKTRISHLLEREPHNIDAQIVLGNALAGLRDLDGAVRQLEEAIRLDPSRSQSYGNLGMLRAQEGQLEEARAAFEKAVALAPRSVQAQLALANFLWSAGTAVETEQALIRAFELDPTHALTSRALAVFYLASNRAAEAERHLKVIADSTHSIEARLALADYYSLMGRRDDAVRTLGMLAGQRAVFSEMHTRLGALEFAAGERRQAYARIERVLRREPNNAPALLLKARWLLAEGKAAEALEWARSAVNANEQSIEARYLIGSILAMTRRTTDAIKSYSDVLRLNSRAVAAQVQLSRLHLARGAVDSAVQLAEEALQIAPNHLDARISRARAWIVRNDIARAEAESELLLRLFPEAASVYSLQGMLRMRGGQLGRAHAMFDKALTLDSGYLEALDAITTIDTLERRVAAARTRIEGRLKVEPRRAELLLLAGRFYLSQDEMPSAERVLRTLIEADPGSAQGYILLGRALTQQRKLGTAKVEFDQIAAREALNLWARIMGAMIAQAEGNMADAARRYEEILKLDQTAAVAANNLAWIYTETGQSLDRALTLAQAAVEHLPDSAEAYDTLGWVYYRRGLHRLAIAPFEQSIDRDPENATYHYHLALAHNGSGDKEAARRAVENALKLQPGLTDAQRLLASLST